MIFDPQLNFLALLLIIEYMYYWGRVSCVGDLFIEQLVQREKRAKMRAWDLKKRSSLHFGTCGTESCCLLGCGREYGEFSSHVPWHITCSLE